MNAPTPLMISTVLLPGKTIAHQFMGKTISAFVGKAGIIDAADKKEGDQATPTGQHKVLYGFYRPDRLEKPITTLPMKPMQREMGWCDAPLHPNYNQLVTLPFEHSHENMWREDNVYDIVLVTDYNMQPAIANKGSAIFIHTQNITRQIPASTNGLSTIDKDHDRGTMGCLMLSNSTLLDILSALTEGQELQWHVSIA